MTAFTDTPRNEILFFTTAHFLFLIFLPQHKTLFRFFATHEPNPRKNERVFSQRSIEIFTFEI